MQRSASGGPLAWDDVRLFVALYRSRTLKEAGRRLSMDASTMSRRLAGLEAVLGATLFERGRSGIAPTEAAIRLMPVAEEMEHVVARFAGEAEAFEREIAGRVRIACPPDAAEVLLAPLLPALLARHPRLAIDLEPGEQVVDLARRTVDLALRTARPTEGDLMVKRLFQVEWTLAAAPELAEQVGLLRRWHDVPWIACTPRLRHTTPGRWYAAHVGDAEPVLRTDSFPVQMASVANGLGVALVPTLSVGFYGLTPLRLSRRLSREVGAWPVDELYMVSHRGLRRVPRVRAVWEFLVERASDAPSGGKVRRRR